MTDRKEVEQPTVGGNLAICAASARWLAQSAQRAGISTTVFDLFGDWDTRQASNVVKLNSFADLTDASMFDGYDSLLVAGGLESNLDVFTGFSKRKVWKNANWSSILRARDPSLWTTKLFQSRLPHAEISLQVDAIDSRTWIQKNVRSTGGFGVNWLAPGGQHGRDSYCQRFQAGQPMSSLHLRSGHSTFLLGAFLQLVGRPDDELPLESIRWVMDDRWEHSVRAALFAPDETATKSFRFCGAIGPVNFPHLTLPMTRAANLIANSIGLEGVFGIDWILRADGEVVPIGINPRFPATGELWESSTGGNLILLHMHAMSGAKISVPGAKYLGGKAIVNFQGDKRTVNSILHEKLRKACEAGRIADVPCRGEILQDGHPLVTVFADQIDQGIDVDDLTAIEKIYRQLAEQAGEVHELSLS